MEYLRLLWIYESVDPVVEMFQWIEQWAFYIMLADMATQLGVVFVPIVKYITFVYITGIKAPGFNIIREINPLTADYHLLTDLLLLVLGSVGLLFGQTSFIGSLYTEYILERE